MASIQRNIMGGLAKGLLAIETFSAERPRQSITDVSNGSGLDRATARRCLLTLAHLGYADYDGKYFTLTPRVLRLGIACLSTMPLPQIVQPVLDGISASIGESSSVSILDGAEIVYIARSARKKVMSIALMPGSRLPAYCTSMGRVLLAALPPDEASAILESAPMHRRTDRTLVESRDVMRQIAKARCDGYAVIDQEVELGLRSIAVPLMNARGRVVAALNIGLPVSEDRPEDLPARYLPALLDAQQQIRRLLQ